MTDLSARWRRIEELCQAALDRPLADRAAFLDEQCANDKDLRIEVERLLAQESAAAGFLNASASGCPVSLSRAAARRLTGRRLNALEIGELLGSGGMGDVYRAHDTLLGRDVAIKVLSREFVDNAEQLARFEREAQILASLNHPNIAQIYGLEHGEGIRAIVMELVHGTTLPGEPKSDDRVLRHSLGVARQIAAALEAAHEQGVIHRDLKPSNIKVRPDGAVKVLDFGLAKTVEATGDGAATDQREASLPITRAGAILGTVAYMSPEQARGLTVDRRSDLWAFGVLLYELLAGTPLFQRDTTADTIAAVMKDEPDWKALPRNLPEPIRTLLRRCLQRDYAKRLDSATAVLLELDDALNSLSERRFSKRAVPSFRQLDLRHGSVLHAKFADSSRAVICSASRNAQQPQLYRVRADGRGSRGIGVKADVLAVSADDQLALLLEKGFPLVEHGIGTLARASLVAGSARHSAGCSTPTRRSPAA